jgi:hypothetical protein
MLRREARGLRHAVLHRDGDRFGPPGDAELGEQVGEMGLDGARTDEERLGDLGIGKT